MRTLLADARRGHSGLYWLAARHGGARARHGRARRGRPARPGRCPALVQADEVLDLDRAVRARAGLDARPAEGASPSRTGWAIVAGLVLEMVIIVGQAARGQKSHLQRRRRRSAACSSRSWVPPSPWSGSLTLAIALRFLREPGRDRAMALAIRLGLVVSLVGMAVGFLLSATAATPSACPTAAGPASSSAGAPRAATCASRTSSACTPSRCCRSLAALLAQPSRSSRPCRTRIVWSVGGRLPRGRAAADLAGVARPAAVRAGRAHARRARRGRPRRARRPPTGAVEPSPSA